MRRALLLGFITVALATEVSAAAGPAARVRPRAPRTAAEARARRFAVLGDGGGDLARHAEVASALVRVHEARPFGTLLLLGDNVHEGQTLADSIERPYAPLIARGVRILPVIGNHDVAGPDGLARAAAQREAFGVPRHYRTLLAPDVEAFAIDTTLFQLGSEELYGPGLARQREAELAWLDRALARSQAGTKVVFGHHSMVTSVRGGDPAQTALLRRTVEPLLVRHGAALYLGGHYHELERSEPIGGVVHIVSGGGGSRLVVPDQNAPHPRAAMSSSHHFLLFEQTPQGLAFEAIAPSGERIDHGVIR
jgi:acid phosphatase